MSRPKQELQAALDKTRRATQAASRLQGTYIHSYNVGRGKLTTTRRELDSLAGLVDEAHDAVIAARSSEYIDDDVDNAADKADDLLAGQLRSLKELRAELKGTYTENTDHGQVTSMLDIQQSRLKRIESHLNKAVQKAD